jgi:V/A-type H+-transporting ATPase subunit A
MDGLEKGADFNALISLPVRETIGRFKYIEEEEIDCSFDTVLEELTNSIQELMNKEDEQDV